jgi:hypothetical protein
MMLNDMSMSPSADNVSSAVNVNGIMLNKGATGGTKLLIAASLEMSTTRIALAGAVVLSAASVDVTTMNITPTTAVPIPALVAGARTSAGASIAPHRLLAAFLEMSWRWRESHFGCLHPRVRFAAPNVIMLNGGATGGWRMLLIVAPRTSSP